MRGGEWNRIVEAADRSRCPVQGCERSIRRTEFMCPRHWREVPDLLKGALREAARETRQVQVDGGIDAAERWREAAVQAMRCVEADIEAG
jgi:hypothetical protein